MMRESKSAPPDALPPNSYHRVLCLPIYHLMCVFPNILLLCLPYKTLLLCLSYKTLLLCLPYKNLLLCLPLSLLLGLPLTSQLWCHPNSHHYHHLVLVLPCLLILSLRYLLIPHLQYNTHPRLVVLHQALQLIYISVMILVYYYVQCPQSESGIYLQINHLWLTILGVVVP